MKLIKCGLALSAVVMFCSISASSFGHVIPEDELRNQVYLTTRQALQKVFAGNLKIKKVMRKLSASQQLQVEEMLQNRIKDTRIEFFTAEVDGRKRYASVGKGFANTHPVTKVRLMVLMNSQGQVEACHIMEYKGPQRAEIISREFLDQFRGKSAESDFSSITSNQGNTLSVQAVSQEVRKILALYSVLYKDS